MSIFLISGISSANENSKCIKKEIKTTGNENIKDMIFSKKGYSYILWRSKVIKYGKEIISYVGDILLGYKKGNKLIYSYQKEDFYLIYEGKNTITTVFLIA